MSARPEIVRKIAKALLERSKKEREELIKTSQLLELKPFNNKAKYD